MPAIRFARPASRALRAGATVLALSAVATGLGAAPVSAAPPRADLGLTVTPDPARILVDGQVVGIGVDIVNHGRAVAEGVSLSFRLPEGVAPAGEGGVPSDSPWQCVLSSPVTRCTHPALAAGATAAPLKLRVRVPAGQDGATVTVPVDVATTSREGSTGDNAGQAVFTYDASIVVPDPHGADLRFISLDTRPYWVIAGDTVRTIYEFENTGDLTAEDVTLRVTLDPRLRPVPADGATFPWQCTTLTDGWECRHEPMATGERALIGFDFTVVGGVAGDLIPFQGVLTTSTPELDSGANEIGTTVEYADTSTVHGQLWQDLDGDGRRDAEDVAVDPAAANASVWLVPTFGGVPDGTPVAVPVNADGSYTVEAKPGEYLVEVRVAAAAYDFTGRDATDDAFDSDVSRYALEGDEVVGRSVSSYVPNGSDLLVDTGLVRVTA